MLMLTQATSSGLSPVLVPTARVYEIVRVVEILERKGERKKERKREREREREGGGE